MNRFVVVWACCGFQCASMQKPGATDAQLDIVKAPASLDRLLAVPAERDARRSPDGQRVAFVSDVSGLDQLYLQDKAGRVTQPVIWPTAMSLVGFSGDGRSVVFAADTSGDEKHGFYRLELETGEVSNLTLSAQQRDSPLLSGNALFYAERDQSSGKTQIMKYRLDRSAGAELLYQDEGIVFLADIDSSQQRLLLIRYLQHQSQQLVLVDLTLASSPTTLYPTAKAASVSAAAFTGAGEVLFTTDDGEEQTQLVWLASAIDSSRRWTERRRYREKEFPFAKAEALLVNGNTAVVGLDAGSRTVVRILQLDTFKSTALALPAGTGTPTVLADDGRSLTLNWSTPSAPTRSYRGDTVLGTASMQVLGVGVRVRAEELSAAVEGVTVTSFDGLPIAVNVMRPAASGKVPVIVYLHGGPAGTATLGYDWMARFFVTQGFAWVAPNIRGSSGFGRAFQAADDGIKRPDSFRDIDAVRNWVCRQPWANSARLVVMGASFGGYLVLQSLVRDSAAWAAGVDAFGISDFTTFLASTTGMVRQNYLTELGDPVEDAARLVTLSPLHQVDRIRSPLFVYAGANDPRVPRSQSEAIVQALSQRGLPVEFMLAENEGHGFSRRQTQREFALRVLSFLKRSFKDVLAATAGN
jgi:dipeptidyl aminopeptidase/acylaminoacyl peptidase